MTIHYNTHIANSKRKNSIISRKKTPRALALTNDKIKVIDNFTSATSKYPFLYPNSSFYPVTVCNYHWQLRNLVKFTSRDSKKVLHVGHNSIKCLDLTSGEVTNACSLDFPAKCFAEKDDLIVSGGLGDTDQAAGKVNLYNPKTETSVTQNIGDVINNNVSIDKFSNNQYISYACNNDMHLYKLDIGNSGINVINKKKLDYHLNYSKLSNDQKLLITSGDDTRLSLIDPNASETVIQQIPVETMPKDCAFSIDFHHSDLYFAVAFQSGRTFLYDIRNLKQSIHTFHSTKKSESTDGAFRHLKFSNYSTDDFLFLTEHYGKVHIVDIRDFDNHKVITLPNNYGKKYIDQAKSSSNNSSSDDKSFSPSSATAYNNDSSIIGGSSSINQHDLLSEPPSLDKNLIDCPIINDYSDIKYTDNIKLQKYYNASSRSLNTSNKLLYDKYNMNQYSYISDYQHYHDSKYNIFGLDWNFDHEGSKLVVGSDHGITKWDIDSWSRRGFCDFEFL